MLAVVTSTVMVQAAVQEEASNVALWADVGALQPVKPFETSDHFVLSLQLPVPPTQKRSVVLHSCRAMSKPALSTAEPDGSLLSPAEVTIRNSPNVVMLVPAVPVFAATAVIAVQLPVAVHVVAFVSLA